MSIHTNGLRLGRGWLCSLRGLWRWRRLARHQCYPFTHARDVNTLVALAGGASSVRAFATGDAGRVLFLLLLALLPALLSAAVATDADAVGGCTTASARGLASGTAPGGFRVLPAPTLDNRRLSTLLPAVSALYVVNK